MATLSEYFAAKAPSGMTFAEYCDVSGISVMTAIRGYEMGKAIQQQFAAKAARQVGPPASGPQPWWKSSAPAPAPRTYWWQSSRGI